MKKFKLITLSVLLVAFVLVVPMMALAQPIDPGSDGSLDPSGCENFGTLFYILCRAAVLLNTIIPVLIVIAVVWFIWGVIQYVIGGDEEAKKKGRDKMIYGLIGLLVIVSIWGLVNILKTTFGIYDDQNIAVVCIETPGVDCPN